MIVIKLMGGLGNQMFQYAYGCMLATQMQEKICFDIDIYKKKERLAITNYNIVDIVDWNDTDIGKAERLQVKVWEKIYHIQQKMIRVLGHTERVGQKVFEWYGEKGYYFNFDPFYYPTPEAHVKNKYIYGYFQGEEYFSQIRSKLQKDFTLKKSMGKHALTIKHAIENSTAVALHVRLGDYTKRKNRYLNVCSEQYYKKAIEYMQRRIQDPTFFIFTNDSFALKKMRFLPETAVIVENTSCNEDMMLMRECQHFIISNSTFSWWGAYLAGNNEKVVIAPNRWTNTQQEMPAIYNDMMTMLSI